MGKKTDVSFSQHGLQCESQSSLGYSTNAESFSSKDLRKKRRREREGRRKVKEGEMGRGMEEGTERRMEGRRKERKEGWKR